MKNNILISGGAGFIGSHLVKFFVNKYPNYNIYNLDNLTYAGNLNNLDDIVDKPNYHFIKADITDYNLLRNIIEENDINKVIHLAAESHVDNSIDNPFIFAQTNVIGTLCLLTAVKEIWANNFSGKLFYHISTDEVYGSLKNDKTLFQESTKYDPKSPYAASKASSDHFVRAFSNTYSLPVIISNSSNNYGPYQYQEKLIPLCINNIINNKSLPVFGNGENIRDWIFVKDHIKAIDIIFHKGSLNESYNIGGLNEWRNIDLIKFLIKKVDKILGRNIGSSNKLITFVKDRPGHDFRYAIDPSKLKNELGWAPISDFETSIEETIKWYLNNQR
tara:strand:+ start:21942 stop:22937 length:996 start_codon:yes stop_codon:yes gene_type:complete